MKEKTMNFTGLAGMLGHWLSYFIMRLLANSGIQIQR